MRSALLAAGTDIPTFLLAAIDRASPFLKMLRHNDGGLALFNGAGEGEDWLIDMLLPGMTAAMTPLPVFGVPVES